MITKPNLKALEKTVFAYESAIIILERGDIGEILEKWVGYGFSDSCNLCKSVNNIEYDSPNCRNCVLGSKKYHCDDDYPCAAPGDKTLPNLMEALDDETNLLPAFRARLKWILERALENGVVVE